MSHVRTNHVTSRICTSHVAHMNESCHTYILVMVHTFTSKSRATMSSATATATLCYYYWWLCRGQLLLTIHLKKPCHTLVSNSPQHIYPQKRPTNLQKSPNNDTFTSKSRATMSSATATATATACCGWWRLRRGLLLLMTLGGVLLPMTYTTTQEPYMHPRRTNIPAKKTMLWLMTV